MTEQLKVGGNQWWGVLLSINPKTCWLAQRRFTPSSPWTTILLDQQKPHKKKKISSTEERPLMLASVQLREVSLSSLYLAFSYARTLRSYLTQMHLGRLTRLLQLMESRLPQKKWTLEECTVFLLMMQQLIKTSWWIQATAWVISVHRPIFLCRSNLRFMPLLVLHLVSCAVQQNGLILRWLNLQAHCTTLSVSLILRIIYPMRCAIQQTYRQSKCKNYLTNNRRYRWDPSNLVCIRRLQTRKKKKFAWTSKFLGIKQLLTSRYGYSSASSMRMTWDILGLSSASGSTHLT